MCHLCVRLTTLQYVAYNKLHIQNDFAVRVEISIQKLAETQCTKIDCRTLVYHTNDNNPDPHHHETTDIATDVLVTPHNRRMKTQKLLAPTRL